MHLFFTFETIYFNKIKPEVFVVKPELPFAIFRALLSPFPSRPPAKRPHPSSFVAKGATGSLICGDFFLFISHFFFIILILFFGFIAISQPFASECTTNCSWTWEEKRRGKSHITNRNKNWREQKMFGWKIQKKNDFNKCHKFSHKYCKRITKEKQERKVREKEGKAKGNGFSIPAPQLLIIVCNRFHYSRKENWPKIIK